MSTVTSTSALADQVAPASASTLSRTGEPPWAKLGAVIVAILLAMGAYTLWIAPQSDQPLPTKAFTGPIGPAGLTVTVTPLVAGGPRQSVTMDFADPATKKPFAQLDSVAVRFVPPAGAGAKAGGPAGPLTAKATLVPGQWIVKLKKAQYVMAPGAWTLKVSARPAPGKAFKTKVPLAYK